MIPLIRIAFYYNELIKLILFGIVFFNIRTEIGKKNRNNSLAVLLCTAIVGVSEIILHNNICFTIICAIVCMGTVKFLVRNVKLRYIVLGYIVVSFVDELSAFGVMSFFGLSTEQLEQGMLLSLAINGIQTIMLVILFMIKKHKGYKGYHLGIENQHVIILLVGAVLSSQIVAYVEMTNIIENMEWREYFRNGEVILLCVLFFIALSSSIFRGVKNEKLNQDIAQTEKMLSNQKDYYMELLNKEEQTKKFRHDFRGHMDCIKTLLAEGDYESLTQYLNSVEEHMSKATLEFSTGNVLINALVADIKCQYSDVDIKWKGKLPAELQIKDMDLCTIFYNLINNACREVSGSVEPVVSVNVRIYHTNLFITVWNKVTNRVEIENNHRVIKKFTEGHGYGLRNVEDATFSYNGSFEISNDNDVFHVDIALPDVV